MDQAVHFVENSGQERFPEASRLPEVKSIANEQAESERSDKTIASRLLSSKPSKDESSDVEITQNAITESSGSDHLSDSRSDSRTPPRPRATSDSHLMKPSLTRDSTITPVGPGDMNIVRRGGGHKSNSPPLLNTSTPQLPYPVAPRAITSSSSAPNTPSAGGDSQTYSFVFTSSRQPGVLGGDGLIGVINPSSSNTLPPPERPPVMPQPRRKSTLTPEQIRAHALGAVHAISQSSPFHSGESARPSTVARMDLPLQTPITDCVDPIDHSLQRHGIDFYVNAARHGRNKPSQASPTSPRPTNIRSFSHVTTLASLGEDKRHIFAQGPPSPTTMSEAPSRRLSKHRRFKTYSRYVEDESNDASFTTTSMVVGRAASVGSSASSRSKQSIDESLTGLSCFGVIGSGTPGSVFGNAVVGPRRSPFDPRPQLIQSASSNVPTPTRTETSEMKTPWT